MRAFAFAILIAIFAGVQPALAMTLSFRWGPTKTCFDPKSPPVRVAGVPKGTARLEFVMHDLDAPDFHHGGGSLRFEGQATFGYGAFRYKGPCPPTRHTYAITVTAVDAANHILATASAERAFPPK